MPEILDNGLVVIRACVGVSSAFREISHAAMEPFRPDVTAMALIDTGADVSIIDSALLESLCIRQKDVTCVMGFNGESKEYPAYDVWFRVINREGNILIENPDLRVVGVDLSGRNYTAIIGMDLLHSFTLKFLHSVGVAEMHPTKV